VSEPTPQSPARRLLSRRAQDELHSLQANVHSAGLQRSSTLRLLVSSRTAATVAAQREFWLEFAVADQEYRAAVRRLAIFCERYREGSPRLRAASAV
jgi:hypothetical protein